MKDFSYLQKEGWVSISCKSDLPTDAHKHYTLGFIDNQQFFDTASRLNVDQLKYLYAAHDGAYSHYKILNLPTIETAVKWFDKTISGGVQFYLHNKYFGLVSPGDPLTDEQKFHICVCESPDLRESGRMTAKDIEQIIGRINRLPRRKNEPTVVGDNPKITRSVLDDFDKTMTFKQQRDHTLMLAHVFSKAIIPDDIDPQSTQECYDFLIEMINDAYNGLEFQSGRLSLHRDTLREIAALRSVPASITKAREVANETLKHNP